MEIANLLNIINITFTKRQTKINTKKFNMPVLGMCNNPTFSPSYIFSTKLVVLKFGNQGKELLNSGF